MGAGPLVLLAIAAAFLLLNKQSPGAGSPNAPPPPPYPPLQPVLVQPGLAPVQGANFPIFSGLPLVTSQAPGYTGVAPTSTPGGAARAGSPDTPGVAAAPAPSAPAPATPGGAARAGSPR
jgi:hypothetical protein